MVAAWTKQTGDTIPEHPTPNRHEPPRIEDGKIVSGGKTKQRNPHSEMPGAASKATEVNHPGPITLAK
jgi:N-sulfoglucosamine sulfohydrolase